MKKYKFLFFTLLLAFLFIPKDVFAADVGTNTITPNSYEFYFESMNLNDELEIQRFNANQLQLYPWGTANADYKLIRLAPLVRFNSLGVDTSYKARVVFYIYTKYPFSYDSKFCSLFSNNGEKYSCSLYREMEDQIGSQEVLLTYVYDYEWTSSVGYVEFWLNFENFSGVPKDTEFMFSILDFQGNVSGNQIILDGLGQTNEKLDEVKDVLKDSFNSCSLKKEQLFYPDDVSIQDNYLDVNGNLVPDSGSGITDYISVLSDTTYNILATSDILNLGSFCFYDSSKNLISCEQFKKRFDFNFNTKKAKYIRISITGSNAKPLILSHNACVNRIDETNEKLDSISKQNEEAEKTRKGIWETLKNLPNTLKDMFLSLFVPDENYFEDKFDELLGNVEDVLGFLAYPFTLISRTFEFFLTIEDTGNYVISWEDVKVPNFEEYSIIEAGSFDFATLLEDSRVASLRNIAFVFINALLLLAFLQLCHNKYNEVFGGDVSTTEFISVAEEYDIDYKTGEVSNIKHIEKKTTRRDI